MALGNQKTSRAYGAGRFVLELDGSNVGVLSGVDGGHFLAEAVGEQVGSEGLVTRYPGRQRFEDITLQIGTTMTATFWKWVQASIDNKYQRRNGAIVVYDFDGNERSRRTFYEAVIVEIGFPALDAKTRGPAQVTVKIAPERVEFKEGGGGKLPAVDLKTQKKFVPANFRVSVDRIDKGVTRWITKVDAVTIKQNVIVNPVGDEMWARKEVGRIEMPTISLYLPETYAKHFYEWWKSFVGEMKHEHDQETTASIELLDSECKDVLMTLSFDGVGITGVTIDKHDAASQELRNVKVDLYTEGMKFSAAS